MARVTDQVASGVSKGVKAIAFALFLLIGGVGLLWTPAGALYPFFLAVSATSRPLDRTLLAPTLICGIVAGVIGCWILIAKGFRGWIGFVLGMLVGPFWTVFLAFGLAAGSAGTSVDGASTDA